MNNKTIIEFCFLGGCYPPRPAADNTLLDLHNSSDDTQPHSIIVKSGALCFQNELQ